MAEVFQNEPATYIIGMKQRRLPLPRRGVHPYKRDLNNLDFYILDTGHFALEENGYVIADHINNFMAKKVVPTL